MTVWTVWTDFRPISSHVRQIRKGDGFPRRLAHERTHHTTRSPRRLAATRIDSHQTSERRRRTRRCADTGAGLDRRFESRNQGNRDKRYLPSYDNTSRRQFDRLAPRGRPRSPGSPSHEPTELRPPPPKRGRDDPFAGGHSAAGNDYYSTSHPHHPPPRGFSTNKESLPLQPPSGSLQVMAFHRTFRQGRNVNWLVSLRAATRMLIELMSQTDSSSRPSAEEALPAMANYPCSCIYLALLLEASGFQGATTVWTNALFHLCITSIYPTVTHIQVAWEDVTTR
jgi:hypothetical protein